MCITSTLALCLSLTHTIRTFSRTLHTYCHHRMRKMITTSRRMMVTRQPIRTDVLLSSGGRGFNVTVLASVKQPKQHSRICIRVLKQELRV